MRELKKSYSRVSASAQKVPHIVALAALLSSFTLGNQAKHNLRPSRLAVYAVKLLLLLTDERLVTIEQDRRLISWVAAVSVRACV